MNKINDIDLNNIQGGTILPYIIEKGDTLGSIASKFNCTVEELQKWNKIEDPNIIDIGQKLIIKF
jgi:N-acetylmuramoyl-L-alanine amidase